MFTTRPEILGTFGVVTSTHWLGSAAGMAMLERGGNAFDACVATGFVLQVVEPHLVGPAGEVPAVFYSAQNAQDRGAVRARHGSGRRHHRALSTRGPEAHSRQRPAGNRRPRCVRRLDDSAARPWHHAAARGSGTCHLLRRAWPPAAPARFRRHQGPEGIFRDRMAYIGRGVLAGRKRSGSHDAVPQSAALAETWKRILKEAEAKGGNREAEIEAARDGFLQRLRRRGHRPLFALERSDGSDAERVIAALSLATIWPDGPQATTRRRPTIITITA